MFAVSDAKSFSKQSELASEFSKYSWRVHKEIVEPMLHMEGPSYDDALPQDEHDCSTFKNLQKQVWYWKPDWDHEATSSSVNSGQATQFTNTTGLNSNSSIHPTTNRSKHDLSTPPLSHSMIHRVVTSPYSSPISTNGRPSPHTTLKAQHTFIPKRNKYTGRKSNASLIDHSPNHHHFVASHSFFNDDEEEGLKEILMEQEAKARKAFTEYRLQLLKTRPISYREFIQNSMTLLEQVMLLNDTQHSHSSLEEYSVRNLLEQMRNRFGFTNEDVEIVLEIYEQAMFSIEKPCVGGSSSSFISSEVFNTFSKSFLNILRQVEQYHVQNSLLL
ncbi:hypothetical protein C9374_010100 [Naegleria lovaniensis]|uniref:Uncharacterized protein n=1 Tax=Naegleria lovaniensis TaxID=51637 RepID=A0AA88KGQ1_NAELO|nr:uncharacterized protein C9374_010100 [Naegleria lovaniensis]KAG2375096.1 hypothetical protein C9374_010100 [Naegleria lovaniensis]